MSKSSLDFVPENASEATWRVLWKARVVRLGITDRRAADAKEFAVQLLGWFAYDLPQAVQQAEGIEILEVGSQLMTSAERVVECYDRLSTKSLETVEELRSEFDAWATHVKALSSHMLLIISHMDRVANRMRDMLGVDEATNVLVRSRLKFDFFGERAKAIRLSAGLSADARFAGKLLAEVDTAIDPKTESDRVRRARRRKEAGYTRYHLNLHDSDIDALARLGLIAPGETDKAAIEAAAQVLVSAAFTFAGGANPFEGMETVALRMHELSRIERGK